MQNLIPLTKALLQAESVTPDVKTALDVVEDTLKSLGFWVERPVFHAEGSIPVENLYARLGTAAPVFCFAGHVDVVPVGDVKDWTYPPFSAHEVDGKIYARGAVDMKSSVTAFIAAVSSLLPSLGEGARRADEDLDTSQLLSDPHPALRATLSHPWERGFSGSIALLITGDEEGPAVNGTKALLEWCKARGEHFDVCLLGEPTCVDQFGDTLKHGRRGSLSGTLTVQGVQGHVAYPEKNDNPVPKLAALVHGIQLEPLDNGTADFQPSNLEFVSIDTGNTAFNVIPAKAHAKFNIRFNELHSAESLKELLHQRAEIISQGKINFSFNFEPAVSDVFVTKHHPFVELVADCVEQVAGIRPVLSTGGGTSDARFIKDYCPVIEFGPINATIHQVDEHIQMAELQGLYEVYKSVLTSYFNL